MRAALLCLLAGCGPRWDETYEEGLRHLHGTFRTDRGGQAAIPFDVLVGETAFAVVAQAEPLRTNLPRLTDGDALLFQADTQSDHLVTNAGFVSPVSVLAWPILDEHPELVEADYEVDVGTLAAETLAYERGEVSLDVWLKSDPDVGAGSVAVRVVWTSGLGDSDAREAFDAAFVTWEAIYAARGLGVERLADTEWGGEPFGLPGETWDVWTAMSAAGPARVVNLVIVEAISSLPQAYGLAGGIPGPIGATGSSGVLVSLSLAAGVDGRLSSVETRILGETLAHETGHYLGLFHPVEIGWDRWDGIGDTPECAAESVCEAEFADNLMFPYPVCTFRECTPQDDLTPEQGRGLHRHPLVD
jgi:hypothetical protein